MNKDLLDGVVRVTGIAAIVLMVGVLGAFGFGWKPGDFVQLGSVLRNDVVNAAGDARLVRQSVSERAILSVRPGTC